MKPLSLKDIKPQDCEITVFGKNFTMRKFDGNDQAWIQEAFTEEERKTLFTDKMSDDQMARIAFHQLRFEDQKAIGKFTVDFVNEDTGKTERKEYLGWQAFRRRLVGLNDKVELFRGLMQNIGLSSPVLKEMFDDAEIKDILEKKSSKRKKVRRTGRK